MNGEDIIDEKIEMEVTKKGNDHNSRGKVDDDDDDILPPGFRFHPTDEELVGFYLKRKVEKKPIKIDLIQHIDVYKFEPWDLPKLASRSSVGEKEWYFFCRRGRKYKNSVRPNRVTGSGFWKATGIDKPIHSLGEFRDCIGLKKSLVYYKGSAGKGTKTDWMMHEFRLPATTKNSTPISAKNQEAEVWTLCRILKREITHKKYSADWIKVPPKQSYSDSSSKTNFSAGDDKAVDRKPVLGDHFYNFSESDQNLMLAGQLNLTAQVPVMATYQSFPTQLGDESHIDWGWDELRPMIDPSMLFGFR